MRALLIDTTKCIGCGACAAGCREANGLPETDAPDLNDKQFTVVKKVTVAGKDVNYRRLCMHCQDPTCVSVCPVGALQKTALGPVTYDAAITPPSLGDRSDIGAVELGVAVLPTSAVSRKVHVGAGTFDISLPLTGPVATECRSGGAMGDYQLVLTFPSAITFTSAAVTSGTGSVSSTMISGPETVEVGGMVVTINLTGVANVQRLTVALCGVTNGTNSGDIGVRVGMLLGDTTGDGSVSSSDVSQTKSQSGQTANAMNFRNDVTVNGGVSSSDISLVKSQSGSALPPSPTAPDPQNQKRSSGEFTGGGPPRSTHRELTEVCCACSGACAKHRADVRHPRVGAKRFVG